ncbi:hypothetical protein DL765_002132 [Monosporascus sp. GIB2]|nr:hypothetical protein DL765_002132 [Monosporascus sp. GIB2]
MGAWRVGINKLRARLREDVGEVLDRAERKHELQELGVRGRRRSILQEASQPRETMAAYGGHSCPRLIREGRDHLPYNARSMRYADKQRAELTMRKITVPTFLIDEAEDEAHDVARQPSFGQILRVNGLLRISESTEGTQECVLSEHSVDAPPSYVPVSYTWGPAESFDSVSQLPTPMPMNNFRTIALNGQAWEVTPSLFDLLQALSSDPETQSVYFWIDALCINQHDVDERTNQVNLMGRIYSQGRNVFIWLGRANEHTAKVSAMISMLAKITTEEMKQRGSLEGLEILQDLRASDSLRRLGLDERTTWDDWLALVCFYHRRWFYRVWTLQELALSNAVVVRWGPEVLDWAELYNAAHLLQRTDVGQAVILRARRHLRSGFDKGFGISLYHGAAHLADRHHGMIREQEEGFRVWLYADQQGCAAATLNFLVVSARAMGASDPRDRVFAFLGIWEKVAKERFGQKLSIEADYTKTVQTTYTEFMTIVLEETGSLNFLSSVQPGYGTNRIEALPSWVPDYSTASAVPVIQYLSGLVPLKDIDAYANIKSCNPPRSDNAKTGGPYTQVGITSRNEVGNRTFEILGHRLVLPSFVFGTVTHIGSSYPEMHAADFEKTAVLLLRSPQRYPDGRSRLQAFHSMLVYDARQPPVSQFRSLWITQFIAQIIIGWQHLKLTPEQYLNQIGIPRFLGLILAGEDDPFIPTFVELKAICERLGFWENGDGDPSGTEMQEMNAEVSKLDLIFQYTYETRRPFLLDNGYFGMTDQDVRPGDTVRIVPGARAFFTFRKDDQQGPGEDRQVLIGETYVTGAMGGEASEYIKQQGRQWENIHVA